MLVDNGETRRDENNVSYATKKSDVECKKYTRDCLLRNRSGLLGCQIFTVRAMLRVKRARCCFYLFSF